MSIVLPDWVAHISTDAEDKDKKKPTTIFSLSVSPDGSRLATGGIDQKVRIWATEPMLDEKVEKMQGAHRLLSTLSRHTGSVVSVRFSPSGRFLATGSDDTVCLIWEFDPHGGGGFGSFGSSEQNVESWRIHRRLTGHESDVVDIAWSADGDDSFLATVGLDSIVNVWSGPGADGRGGFELVKRIAGHDGFVKGVVWDPKGQFLATQSDDKTLKIWRTSDWSLAKIIREPFEHSPSSNFFGRPSWAPDGGCIVAANSMNGPVFTANVIDRGSWGTGIKLVGHEDSVVVAAFSPRLFNGNGGPPSTLLALGSRDQSISVWITGEPRPLLVLRDIFERQVTDLSWGQDGLTLYASSTAGSVAVISLSPSDVTEPLPLSERPIQKPRPRNLPVFANTTMGAPSAGGVNMLQPRKAGQMPSVPRASVTAPSGPPRASARTATPVPMGGAPLPANARAGGQRLNQQIQITANGKRRIRPTLMSDDGASQQMDIDMGAQAQQQQLASQPPAVSQQDQQQQAYFAAMSHVLSQQQATHTAQPAASATAGPVQLGGATFAPGTQFNLTGPTYIIQRSAPVKAGEEGDADVDMDVAANAHFPSSTIEPGLAANRLARTKGRETRDAHQREAAGPVVYLRPEFRPGDEVFFGRAKAVALPLPPVLSVLRREGAEGVGFVEVRNCADGSRPVEVSVQEDGKPPALTSTGSSSSTIQPTWTDYLPSNVVRVSLSAPYVCLALDTGVILVHSSKTGRRLSTLALDSSVSFMESRGPHLMALTTSGLLHRWNIKTDREIHRPISCLSLLTKQDDVHQVYLHHTGTPILVMRSAEEAWTIDPAKGTWALLASGWFAECSPLWETRGRGSRQSVTSTPTSTPGLAHAMAIAAGAPPHSPAAGGANGPPGTPGATVTSQGATANSPNGGGEGAATAPAAAAAPAVPASAYPSGVVQTDSSGRWREPIRAIESEINSLVVARTSSNPAPRHPRPFADDTARCREFALSASLRHLEVRMTGAMLLSSKDEWLHALRGYARKLGEEVGGGTKSLADELVRELLGPVY
ncbi:WD40 repeat-like protein [Jaminaea rosea]|uniref:Protein HIR n=1 Tax=Jaminaea rosea TaxID=1569628 RepID=A0A316UJK7_9BASI|nr:WD40 repeat-like protein [Jaminaea rosea]PWN25114.1 WD40 repeat-like protein [Jaminaea rosea]